MRRYLILQNLAFLLLLVVTVIELQQIIHNRRLTREGKQAHIALCAFKVDLASRVVSSERFLLNHPDGVPGQFTRADLLSSLESKQRALAALDPLRCVP